MVKFIRAMCVVSICLLSAAVFAAERSNLSLEKNGRVLWSASSELKVEVQKPVLTCKNERSKFNIDKPEESTYGLPLIIEEETDESLLPVEVKLKSHTAKAESILLTYDVSSDWPVNIEGQYHVSLSSASDSDAIYYEAELDLDFPVRADLEVMNEFEVKDSSASKMVCPERDGQLRVYELNPGKYGTYGALRYEMGAKAASGLSSREISLESTVDPTQHLYGWDEDIPKEFSGTPVLGPMMQIPVVHEQFRLTRNELGIPVFGLEFEKEDKKQHLAVSVDPYCGAYLQSVPKKQSTSITVSTTYHGQTVPLKKEDRTVLLEFLPENGKELTEPECVDAMLNSFYKTIPEIQPGPEWTDQIHLVYYDFLSDGGEGWYKGLRHLADKIPEKYRDRAAVCIHGWYDYFQQYAYDHSKGELIDQWTAMQGTGKISMSLEQMHKRIKFSNDLGFHTLLYFADGTNSDSGAPEFSPDYLWRNKKGISVPGWKGPDSKGQPLRMDPAVPEVREWFKGYLKALIKEYGQEVDAFVWDETYYILPNTISYAQDVPTYSDREMITLTAELTKIVQDNRENPDLAFLVSDNGRNFNALATHGTFQDSAMRPYIWGPSMFINYRNCLWSCLWYPVTSPDYNRHSAELGFPQGVSNGAGNNKGPHQMPQDLLDRIIQRFIKNVENDKKRARYFGINGEPVSCSSLNNE
ncbi:hypothetical protein [Sedimentisphaera salicampi]|uniref:Glycoside hydrolase 123 C-terminal domain-containing protein n=1 Tax=Sedimentisphaera salicampi TaxID=1941349 RepID=A0A1W6LQC0_9BACT|nr:hypothetical protein [Sedimentisphaera salicampi]ARN57995.1 hypothetical protein STSP1_02421 [Sedimentisphaera salicampi]